jgi:hypothetical protein
MWQTVVIIASDITASSAAGMAVAVLVGSEVAAIAHDDQVRVRRVDAATVRVGTGSTDNAQGDPRSLGVVNLDKEDAPTVACVEGWLL